MQSIFKSTVLCYFLSGRLKKVLVLSGVRVFLYALGHEGTKESSQLKILVYTIYILDNKTN